MKQLSLFNSKELISISESIVLIASNSDVFTKRCTVVFKNGYSLSIIIGSGTYGGNRGLYEISPIDINGDMNGELLDFKGDDVLGFLTEIEVIEYMKILANK